MTTSSHIADVDRHTFEDLVLRKSREVPVLVDFWAAWCGPCRTLMPLLAQLAESYSGRFFLAKVDTEREQELAGRYGIRSLPTVKLFKNGEVVDEFLGAQPEPVIRQMLDRHIPRPSAELVSQAVAAREAGRAVEALELLEKARALDPDDDELRLEKARTLAELNRLDEAGEEIAALPHDARQQPQAQAVAARLEFARIAAAAPAAELDRTVAAHPEDVEARYRLSAHQILAGEYEAAMDNLLEIVRRDRRFGDDAARRALLSLFKLLGHEHPLVKRYRPRLANAIN